MNEFIKQQLNSCKVANIPPFDDKTTYLKIEKTEILTPKMMLKDHIYLIKINNGVKSDSTLASNWNNNRYPIGDYYKVEKIDSLGTMIKVNGVGFDIKTNTDLYSDSFFGYLPEDGFSIMEEI